MPASCWLSIRKWLSLGLACAPLLSWPALSSRQRRILFLRSLPAGLCSSALDKVYGLSSLHFLPPHSLLFYLPLSPPEKELFFFFSDIICVCLEKVDSAALVYMIQRHNTEYTSFIIIETYTEHVMIAKRIIEQQHDVTVKLEALPSLIPVIAKIQLWG